MFNQNKCIYSWGLVVFSLLKASCSSVGPSVSPFCAPCRESIIIISHWDLNLTLASAELYAPTAPDGKGYECGGGCGCRLIWLAEVCWGFLMWDVFFTLDWQLICTKENIHTQSQTLYCIVLYCNRLEGSKGWWHRRSVGTWFWWCLPIYLPKKESISYHPPKDDSIRLTFKVKRKEASQSVCRFKQNQLNFLVFHKYLKIVLCCHSFLYFLLLCSNILDSLSHILPVKSHKPLWQQALQEQITVLLSCCALTSCGDVVMRWAHILHTTWGINKKRHRSLNLCKLGRHVIWIPRFCILLSNTSEIVDIVDTFLTL